MIADHDMKITKNFSLRELTKSDTAIRHGISQRPNAQVIGNLSMLCIEVLQPIRDHFGPVIVTSGYRSPALNKLVGGSVNSHHVLGMAADIEVPGVTNYDLAEWIRNNLDFTQCILEFYEPGVPHSGWVHVSFNKQDLRNETLTASRVGKGVVYTGGFVV